MQQLIYTSKASPDFTGGDVFDIIQKAASKNRKQDITGVLAITQGRFFQALEGPGEKLDALMSVIEKDRRHHSLSVLMRRPITERQFPDWSMRRFEIDDPREAQSEFHELLSRHHDAEAILRGFERFIAECDRVKS